MKLFCFNKLEFPRFLSFQFWPLSWNWKLGKLGNIFNTCKFQRMCLLEEVGNFRDFRLFDFGPSTEIWNSKNSKIFSRIAYFKGFVLFKEVIGNFRGFQVFDFDPYTEIENSEKSEIFSRLVNFKGFVLFEEVGNFRGFRVSDFDRYAEIENSENLEIFC